MTASVLPKLIERQERLMETRERMQAIYAALLSVFATTFTALTSEQRMALAIDIDDMMTVEDLSSSRAALIMRRRIEPAPLESYANVLLIGYREKVKA